MYPVIVETSFVSLGSLSIDNMNFPLSEIIIICCLMTWTVGSPITFMLADQYGRHYMIPYNNQDYYKPVERSDHVTTHDDDYGGHSQGGFQPSTGDHYGSSDQQEYPSSFSGYEYNSQPSYDQGVHGGYDYSEHQSGGDVHGDNHVHSVPVSEHVEVTKPVAVPVYKEIGVPVAQPVKIHIPHPVAVGIAQPYPVAVPVSHPVPIQIIKTIAVPVERKVPYAVEKHIPVPIEKPVPIHVERHIPVPVEKPYPIKIPVYKTIHHHAKSHHGH
ncbi:hypothetical protein PV325_007115 [Microctonus aethiopoides]|nr:hypothetical protein PV325_007115 [Microctonus aethiopoides]